MQRFLQLQIGGNMKNKGLDCLALTIAIIGAINWGLIGLFSFDLVAFVFGNMSWFSRIIYALVGIAGGIFLIPLTMILKNNIAFRKTVDLFYRFIRSLSA